MDEITTRQEYPISTKVVSLIGTEDNSILSPSRTYQVPAFQRPYEWAETQIDSLLHSIDRAIDGEKVFMGTVQFNRQTNNGEEYYDIIDGQQRITTFILLLCALSRRTSTQLTINNIQLNNIGTDTPESKQLSDILKDLPEQALDDSDKHTYDIFGRYKENYIILQKYLDEKEKEIESAFQLTYILQAITENLYFVELTTDKMPLPKVVGIFNTINSTGLDLNSVDMFKLQLYEYLKDQEPNAMAEICRLYKKVDAFNLPLTNESETISMEEIINAYKLCITAKFGLPYKRWKESNEKFFDDIFKEQSNQRPDLLSLESFEKLVDICLGLKGALNQHKIQTIDAFTIHLLWDTRYGKYSVLPYVFAFFSKDDDYQKALHNALTVYKYLLVNTVNFNKLINSVNTFICKEILPTITQNDETALNKKIANAIKDNPQGWGNADWGATEFERRVKNGLYYNSKRCNAVCVLVALLEEMEEKTAIHIIKERLFSWDTYKYDIEHIYARNLFTAQTNAELFNGIGNLVVLERNINRKIGDKSFVEKKKEYEQSNFVSVHKVKAQSKWDEDDVVKRANIQYQILKKFIFG